MAKVVLDAGHGGYDFGATNGTRMEKDDNLAMVLAVGPILQNCGVNVIYTRTSDVFIPLLERSQISNNANADMFVSIHRDSSTNPNYNGVTNFVHTTAGSKDVANANLVLNRVVSAGVQSSHGLQYANYSVLRETRAPSMLFELGFISNTEDNRLFDTRFNEYARAIASGILSSLGINCVGVNSPAGTPSPLPIPPVVPPNPMPPTLPPINPIEPPPTQPPTEPPPTTPAPPPGDYTANVRSIQQRLNSDYGAGLTVDGIWGPESKRALIRAYQTELNRQFNAGLVVDGLWGPRTRAATRLLRVGDRGNLVWILQSALYTNGFPAVQDGIFGSQTDAQVRAFQRARGLGVDGIAGPNTFERLFQWVR